MGIALLGNLVECVAGKPFEQYCKANIFQPLDMNNTSWFFGRLMQIKLQCLTVILIRYSNVNL